MSRRVADEIMLDVLMGRKKVTFDGNRLGSQRMRRILLVHGPRWCYCAFEFAVVYVCKCCCCRNSYGLCDSAFEEKARLVTTCLTWTRIRSWPREDFLLLLRRFPGQMTTSLPGHSTSSGLSAEGSASLQAISSSINSSMGPRIDTANSQLASMTHRKISIESSVSS